jgi:hypothetical protein
MAGAATRPDGAPAGCLSVDFVRSLRLGQAPR